MPPIADKFTLSNHVIIPALRFATWSVCEITSTYVASIRHEVKDVC